MFTDRGEEGRERGRRTCANVADLRDAISRTMEIGREGQSGCLNRVAKEVWGKGITYIPA